MALILLKIPSIVPRDSRQSHSSAKWPACSWCSLLFFFFFTFLVMHFHIGKKLSFYNDASSCSHSASSYDPRPSVRHSCTYAHCQLVRPSPVDRHCHNSCHAAHFPHFPQHQPASFAPNPHPIPYHSSSHPFHIPAPLCVVASTPTPSCQAIQSRPVPIPSIFPTNDFASFGGAQTFFNYANVGLPSSFYPPGIVVIEAMAAFKRGLNLHIHYFGGMRSANVCL